MSLDLLALLQGKPASERPAANRSVPSGTSPAPASAPDGGSRKPFFTAGSYVVDVPPPSPSYVISSSGSVQFAGPNTVVPGPAPGSSY
jgi:hypothetical protein